MAESELISIRNLQAREAGTPLRDISGVLDSYYPDERQFGTVVVLNLKDLEVKKSVEPYHFPTAQISIKLSNKENSGWGVFSQSLAKLIPESQDIKDCVGKRMSMRMLEGHEYGTDRITGDKMIGNPWEVYEVGGVVAGAKATTAVDEARKLLDGKTRAEFNKEAYANPIIRKDAVFQRAITDKSFINSMLQLEEFEEDENGVFHQVVKKE